MARGILQLLHGHGAVLFAAAIPRNVRKPSSVEAEEYLAEDQVFLFERFFYFLEAKRKHGVLVMDEVDKAQDRRFVARLQGTSRRQ